MNTKPYFSIITCTYNSERYLPKTLMSIESQRFRDFEHIFIDGFSTDKTMKIIKEYKGRNKDIKVKIFRFRPRGISEAMNVGIKKSKGEVIHFLHSDDYYLNMNSLIWANNLLKDNPNKKWLVGRGLYENRVLHYLIRTFRRLNSFYWVLLAQNIISHPNTFVKREIFNQYGSFDKNLKISMDYDYWIRISESFPPYLIKRQFVTVRIHPQSASSNWKGSFKGFIEEIKCLKFLFTKRSKKRYIIFLPFVFFWKLIFHTVRLIKKSLSS